MPEKLLGSFVEGYNLLQSDPVVELSGLSTLLALTTRTFARRDFLARRESGVRSCITEDELSGRMLDPQYPRDPASILSRTELSAAFDPIADRTKDSSAPSMSVLSDFDRSMSLIVEDLAPYVRSIVAYDLRLEQKRLRLSSLLSEGGRDGKRIRTTRASRAALEGGSKAHTRRERWLPNGTNPALVLRTGGECWQDIKTELKDGAGSDSGVCSS